MCDEHENRRAKSKCSSKSCIVHIAIISLFPPVIDLVPQNWREEIIEQLNAILLQILPSLFPLTNVIDIFQCQLSKPACMSQPETQPSISDDELSRIEEAMMVEIDFR